MDTAPTTAPAAIERLRANEYDLLITDLQMPGIGGLSVIREAADSSSGLPVVIVTGRSTEASAIEALNLGVSAYLTKPFRHGQYHGRRGARARQTRSRALPA